MRLERTSAAVEHELWWLTPAYIAGIMAVVVSIGAYWIPPGIYRSYWRSPKYFDLRHMQMILSFAVAFCAGSIIGGYQRIHGLPEAGPIRDWRRDLPFGVIEKLFNAFFWLSLFGYVTWAAAAVSRGANLAVAMGVLRGEKGAAELMKNDYLITISGVTTLTQLAIAMGILGVLIGLTKGWKPVLWKFAVILIATVVRALMNSERLAIIELVIPAVTIFIRLGVLDNELWKGRFWPLLRAMPVFAFSGLFMIFGASEYFRSWTNYYAGGDLSFFEFVSFRLLGYYVTALNNGAVLVDNLTATGVPYMSLHVLWRFPVISNIVKLFFPDIPLDWVGDDAYMSILNRQGNPEFNNGCGWLLPMMDFGFWATVVYWLICGLVCGMLYRSFQRRQVWGLMLYPIIFISIVELPRVLYWAEGRNLVPVLAMSVVALISVRYARQWRAPAAAASPVEEGAWQRSR